MKKIALRIVALLVAIAALFAFCGCNRQEETSSAPVEVPTTTTTTTTKPQLGLNALTGVEDMKTDNDRPVAFVITDEDQHHIQLNLETADMYFEAETEGGIPRILAIFSSIDRIPKELGPVRSARPHFVKIADALDAIYCHIGGSYSGLSTIKELGVDDIYGAEQINDILKNSKNFSWNRKTFVDEKVRKEITRCGYSLTTDRTSPYQFGEKAGTTTANTVVVRISNSYDMAFTYDSTRGVYQKHRNSLNTPIHTTYTGGTVEASNVIVMYDHRFVDPNDANRYDFDLKSGSGILVSGGTSREIRWVRDNSGLHYYENDGTTPLTVATGKTYVCLASDTLKGRTRIS